MGFSVDILKPIYLNFYTNPNKSDFALAANVKGGRGLKNHLEGEKEHPILPKLVQEWASDPDLHPDEVWLVK